MPVACYSRQSLLQALPINLAKTSSELHCRLKSCLFSQPSSLPSFHRCQICTEVRRLSPPVPNLSPCIFLGCFPNTCLAHLVALWHLFSEDLYRHRNQLIEQKEPKVHWLLDCWQIENCWTLGSILLHFPNNWKFCEKSVKCAICESFG